MITNSFALLPQAALLGSAKKPRKCLISPRSSGSEVRTKCPHGNRAVSIGTAFAHNEKRAFVSPTPIFYYCLISLLEFCGPVLAGWKGEVGEVLRVWGLRQSGRVQELPTQDGRALRRQTQPRAPSSFLPETAICFFITVKILSRVALCARDWYRIYWLLVWSCRKMTCNGGRSKIRNLNCLRIRRSAFLRSWPTNAKREQNTQHWS